jgi:Tfp pilus assembly protein PilO
LKSSKIALTQANVTKFKTQYDEIKEKYENLLLHLDTANPPHQDMTPLEFKEELLKTEQLLVERANLWNIIIPNAIGFDEFEGGNIPSQADIPQLALQLDALRTLINFLIESQVYKIKGISKKGLQDIVVSPNQVMYQILPFELSIEGSMESLQTFLYKIRSASHFLVIRKIDIESQKGETLSINLQIDNIRLKREVK